MSDTRPKTILVTGAASGFGRGVAFDLARRGCHVIAGCQIWPQVWEMRQAAQAEGLTMQVIKLDVLDEIDRTHALGLEIDVLVNNAGIMESGPMVEIPMARVRAVFETNVFAALALVQGFGRQMVQRGADRIVWTSSIAGLLKVPYDGAYAASKHAVEGICSALHEELKPYGVEVMTINPGAFRTGFNDTGMETMDQWWDQGDRVVAHWPVRALSGQADPAEMIAAMADAILMENPPYRTMRPLSAIALTQEEQAASWDRKVK